MQLQFRSVHNAMISGFSAQELSVISSWYSTHKWESRTSISPGWRTVPASSRSMSTHLGLLCSASRAMCAFKALMRIYGFVWSLMVLTIWVQRSWTEVWIFKEDLKAWNRQCPSYGTKNAWKILFGVAWIACERFSSNCAMMRCIELGACFFWFLEPGWDIAELFDLEVFVVLSLEGGAADCCFFACCFLGKIGCCLIDCLESSGSQFPAVS